jgi:hypothetical protein
MPSNLLIGYSSTALDATLTLVSGSADSSYPLANIALGDRGKIFRLSAAANEVEIKMDLGASATATTSYLFVARANLLKAQGATKLTLRSSADDVTYTDIIGTNSGLQTRTFTGPASEDLVFTATLNDQIASSLPSTARRYWRLKFGDSVVSKAWNFSKVFCGEWFDMGRDPVAPLTMKRERDSDSARRARYELTLEYQGVTDAKVEEFMTRVWQRKDVAPVVLYDSGNVLLYGMRTLHCGISSVERTRTHKNVNALRIQLEELV